MNATDKIRQRLQSCRLLSYRQDGNTITVDPKSTEGFSVSLTATGNEFIVSFDGWHENFRSEAEALKCFALGLGEQCRLKVFRRGTIDYRWTLEYRTKEGWKEDSATGLLLFPFWRKREVIYRQNAVIGGEGFPTY